MVPEYSVFCWDKIKNTQFRFRETYQSCDELIQSDRFEINGIIYSNGTILREGKYDFGIVERPEEIEVTFGEITINGTIYKKGKIMRLEKGDQNCWSFDGPATYFCKFL